MPLILLSILGWGFLLWYAHSHPIKGVPFNLRGGGGGNDEPAPLPSFQSQIPDWAQGLPPEILQYIQQGVGKQSIEPTEYGISSQALQNLLQYQPSQFQYPMEDIQRALAAQQELQMQQYQQQMRPVMAQQGQLDSTYYANMIGDYLKNQQAQTYGTTADLLTNQATQNYNLQQWLPQFQSDVAGQLAGIGGQRAQIDQYNLQYPYSTYIPALQQMYGTGLNQAQQQYQSAMAQWQSDEQIRQNEEAQRNALYSTIGSFSPLGGAIYGGVSGGSSGLTSSLGGSMDTLKMLLSLGGSLGSSGGSSGMDLSGLGSSMYSPQWNTSYGGGSSGSSTPYNVQGMYMPQYKNY